MHGFSDAFELRVPSLCDPCKEVEVRCSVYYGLNVIAEEEIHGSEVWGLSWPCDCSASVNRVVKIGLIEITPHIIQEMNFLAHVCVGRALNYLPRLAQLHMRRHNVCSPILYN
ncbi:hypothetical protein AVEN_266922-1 [Araneus ventricosus]|uniref:Uncharacterized protein n=1 Tax=Araneus ventricosus TaxID=182803 RepID=A0A4Y2DGP6_ARAVE|nr:hypothetical protein AVEN_266922-1 [Araneus ventricosus]